MRWLTTLKRIFGKSETPKDTQSLTGEQAALYNEMREYAARVRRIETQIKVQTRQE